MMPAVPLPPVSLFALALTCGATACHPDSKPVEETPDAGTADWDFFQAQCDGTRYCQQLTPSGPAHHFGNTVGVIDCTERAGIVMYSDWGTETFAFHWQGPVRRRGLFPIHGHTALISGSRPNIPGFPLAFYSVDPDGFVGFRLAPNSVFIPLRGHASVDHQFEAIVAVETPDGSPDPRISVAIEGPDGAHAIHQGLGIGGSFAWGEHQAKVLRIVPATQGEGIGPIGWVEFSLAPMPASDARSPSTSHSR